MMSKAELARKAGLSTLTIDRVEAGRPCRLDTKRKILLALGRKVSDKDRVFGLSRPEPVREQTGASQELQHPGVEVRTDGGNDSPDAGGDEARLHRVR